MVLCVRACVCRERETERQTGEREKGGGPGSVREERGGPVCACVCVYTFCLFRRLTRHDIP